MQLLLQDEVQKKHPMLGVDSSLPPEGILSGRSLPSWINDGPLYELFVRNFSPEGSFCGTEKKLAYLHELGIKTIWLMPIHPIGKEKRKGSLGCPYAILDHMAINPDYGTARDLKHLVDAVHDHDMRIIIDMVLNHGARDHVKFKLNPEMFNSEFIHSPQEWSDAREFNYNYPETTKYAFDVLKHWIQEFNIDGYRCDVAGMIPRMFWENSVEKLLDIKADLYMLAEWQDRALLNRAFHSTYDWTLYLLMKDVQRSKRSASDLLTWQEQIRHGYPENACPLKFTENHDMPRTITTFKSKQFYPFSAFSFFVPGVPLIYNGQEQGFKIEPSLFEKTAMDWQAMDEKIHEFYKKLIRIRYTNKSVFNGNLENISNDQPENVVSFARNDENSKIIIILNFKNGAVSVNIQTEDDFRNIFFSDLMTGSRIRPVDGNIELKANQVMVLEG